MNNCIKGLIAGIDSSCNVPVVGGIEVKAILINRKDVESITLDATQKNKVTDITLKTGTQGYLLTGIKKSLGAFSDLSQKENRKNTWLHKISFEQFQIDAASVENVDNMDDFICVMELKNKGEQADGTFIIQGLKQGLYISADSWSANDADGARILEGSSLEDGGEQFSKWVLHSTDYATTKNLFDGLTDAATKKNNTPTTKQK